MIAKDDMAFIFLGIIMALALLIIQVSHNKTRNVKDIRVQLSLGVAMNTVFLFSLFTNDEQILSLLYTTVLIIESWILYFFLHYAHARNTFWKNYKEMYGKALVLLVLIDNIVLAINGICGTLFKFRKMTYEGNEYVCAEWDGFFLVHWIGCIIISILVVIVMAKKALSVAKIYRLKYWVSCIGFGTGIIFALTARLVSDNMNMWSILIISLGIIGYYYIYFMFPILRATRMKNYAINNMTDPVLMFDYNDTLQVYNDAAERMLGVSLYYSIVDYIKENELYYNMEPRGRRREKDIEFTRTKILGGKTFLIHGRELWDEKDRFIGTLIIYTDITGQEKLKDEATLYATRDQLTGLWNRDYFFEMVDKTIRDNPNEDFVMIVSDVHQFKMFNEILGARTGDDLLLAVAQGYRERYKRLWVFSRVSGDRFGLLMPKSDFNEERFLQFVHDVFNRKHFSLKVHCYIGVYEVVDRRIGGETMYDRAYMALESIKGDLQKEIAYYHEEILNKRIFETTTLDEMDRALLNNEFVIYLQPQVDIRKHEVVSAEALIRWNKPGRGIVPPNEFIPIFEHNGMIAKLDYYVWELACKQLYIWKHEGFENRSISVNISAKDFYLSDLYESITGLIKKYDINPVNLKLEITETAFVLDIRKQMELVRRLQEFGFIIEIDDFGSGYSSLNSLKDISVDVLKMDLKFFEKTEDISTDRAEKIVRSVVLLANELGMPVIAEGVECEEDLEMLKRVGCQMVQGYYYAKPMSVSDFEEFVKGYGYGDMSKIIEEVKISD